MTRCRRIRSMNARMQSRTDASTLWSPKRLYAFANGEQSYCGGRECSPGILQAVNGTVQNDCDSTHLRRRIFHSQYRQRSGISPTTPPPSVPQTPVAPETYPRPYHLGRMVSGPKFDRWPRLTSTYKAFNCRPKCIVHIHG